ncbi:MAG: 3'-5' exonuclease [Hyphomicrobium sp.]|uniref:nuclease-related domain-containing DEAD/DEAH box helicase n=1 Tax=Hyphomicrobium sp. TaxID=82 RepID=UPI003D140244
MAEMVPEALPASSTAGEKRVFAALERLPEDCLVYYEAVVRKRHPDLIVILPEVGVLVIEVKDWRLAELESVTADTVTISRRGRSERVLHPLKQARDYMLRLMDECRKHPQARKLIREDGPFPGKFAFPFCHVAVLSNINRSQIEHEAPELTRLFPPGVTVTRDELASWDALDPQALLARLKASFDPWWPFPKMTPDQVNILRSVIHPEVIIRASETELAVLDLRQERNARSIGDGHRIVYGVAGSGKTVLLIARARLLAADPEKRILLLCYNRLLAQNLASALSGCRGVMAMTFHRWGVGSGVDFHKDEDDSAFGERLLARLKGEAGLCGRFDAVLIDEAQDWPCSWFQCVKLALSEPDTGDLMIVGDGSQSLYRKRDFTWADAGIHASGRAINRKLDLDRNYRNTAEILHAARAFSGPLGSSVQGVLALPVEPDTAIRSGPEPWLIQLDDATSEMHYAAALIETWLRGGLEIGGRHQRIKPSDIAVLYPRRRPDASATTLCDRLNGFSRAVLLSGDSPTGTLHDEAVKILPMHSARGLQFRIVLLLWVNLLGSRSDSGNAEIDRRLLYVAMTRAEDLLVILHSGRSSCVDELYRVLGKAPRQ